MSRKSTSSAAAEALAVTRPIQEDPDKLGGAPTIGAQRVHAETLIDYFAGGLTLEDFLEDFEGTPRSRVVLRRRHDPARALLRGAATRRDPNLR